MRKKILILIFSCFVWGCFASEVEKKPFKAAVLSFIIPGGGQFYNESYWKFGAVCAIEGTLIGLTAYNYFKSEDCYNKYKTNPENEDYYDKYSDYYYKSQNTLWWLGTFIFISTIDAYVDAHLFNFDKEKRRIRLEFKDNAISLAYYF
ncbi:MAG: hypothetical protein KAT74_10805 [Candidatus Cloacimonetes bacterium]|nr:hypothetical protein [Candidatus Cloacimonadota bacterium]